MKFLVLLMFFEVARGQYVYQRPQNQLSSASSSSSSSSHSSHLPSEQFTGYQSSSSSSLASQANLAISTSGLATSASHIEPIIKKYFYVHVAPDEPQEATSGVAQPHVQPEKHYQIIFIKVASPQQQKQVVVNQQPAIEEKTLVYVLSQSPQPQQPIEIPKQEAKKPSKPEVYFVKYKNQKKIGNVNGIQEASLIGGGSVNENQINSDLVAGGGLPEASNSQYSQSNLAESSSSSASGYSQYDSASSLSSSNAGNGPLLNSFGTSSSSQHGGFEAYGIPNQSGPY